MRYQYLLIAVLFSLCGNANAEWFLRGTHNAWAAAQMESAGAGTNTMQLKNVVFTAAGNIKFDRFGDWKENYGTGGLGGGNIAVAAGTWDIKFFTDTKNWNIAVSQAVASSSSMKSSSNSSVVVISSSIKSSVASSSVASSAPASIYHVRGTFNGWLEGTLMSRVGTTDNYERCVNFVGGDTNGGPRFKIDPNGAWGDGIPAADFVVTAGWVKISFNSVSKAITTQQNLAANCAAASSSSSVSSSKSSVASSSVTSSAPASIYHVRGTFNGWLEGTLMSRVGTTDSYERCVNFVGGDTNGGPRFKIDPNGAWGDGIPAADFVVTAGWVKILFNSTTKAISVQQNLPANCGVSSSSSSAISSSVSSSSVVVSSSSSSLTMTLNVAASDGRVYANETASLNASISSGTGWQYQWKLIQDETYNRKDIYDLTWNRDNEDFRCQAESVGQRISGKLYPPTNGMYKFAVAADDMHELRITKNTISQLLTSSVQPVAPANFNNTSQLIELSANTVYPFEFLYINKAGSGHFSVLWQKPGSSQWEEVPIDVFSKPEETTATGVLLQETFNESLTSFSQLSSLSSFINSRSNKSTAVFNGQNISFTPQQNKTYSFEVTATSGTSVVKNIISFYAEGRLVSEDNTNAASAWIKAGTNDSNLLSLMKLTPAVDGTATGKVLEISAPVGGSSAEWVQTVFLKPYTAYEVRARVRLLNAPSNLEVPRSINDGERLWKLPRVRVGVHGDASEQGIDAVNPGQWHDVAVDFVVPFHGAVDLHLQMGNNAGQGVYSGTFQVDNIRIEKLSGNGVTQFEFPNLAANIYDDFVTKTGGVEATKNYFARISRAAENMRKLSGKSFVTQCTKQNIFVPKDWDVFALGTNLGNGMILKNANLLSDDFLRDVWGSTNIVGGVMIHEVEHSFDFPGSSFNSHLPLLGQVYAMEADNLLRTQDGHIVNAREWIAQERAAKSTCSMDTTALLPKLYQFQDQFLTGDKWAPFKQIMHDRWSPYKIEVEGRVWPNDAFGQYRMWWSELQSYTGLDGWSLMHTPAEQSTIQTMFERKANPVQSTIDAANLSGSEDRLFLHKALRTSTSVGFGDLDINDMVEVNNQCRTNNIYAHAPSSLTYQLNKQWIAFNTQAVIKDNSIPGRVVAKISGDGVELYRSPSFTAQTSPVSSGVVDISNVNVLKLEFLDDGNNNSDWSVWIDPQLSRNQFGANNFASTGQVIKHSSGKCVAPEFGGSPAMNERAVLSDDCSSSNAKFKLLASGALLHINSGACLHPNGGSSTPSNGTSWVFFPHCTGGANIQYDKTALASIKHRSGGSCIHPSGDSAAPAAGTPLVFSQGCDQESLRFNFE